MDIAKEGSKFAIIGTQMQIKRSFDFQPIRIVRVFRTCISLIFSVAFDQTCLRKKSQSRFRYNSRRLDTELVCLQQSRSYGNYVEIVRAISHAGFLYHHVDSLLQKLEHCYREVDSGWQSQIHDN